MIKKYLAGLLFSLALGAASTASAKTIELALLLDGSGSISSGDWALQLDGYKNAFATGTFYDDVVAVSPFDTLLVRAWQFSNTVLSETGWVSINNNADATAFGNLFTTSNMAQIGSTTATGDAMQVAVNALLGNGIDGDKMVIDVSTDGNPVPSSSQIPKALNWANIGANHDITTNAVGVGGNISMSFLNDLTAPSNGFVLTANSFNEFAPTIAEKLGKEINVPGPASLLLMLIGIAGLVGSRRTAR